MIRLLLMTLLTLFGFENTNKPKYDLHKQVTLTDRINAWFNRHKYTILLIIIAVSMVVGVIALVKWFPAMDPWNNRFDGVI